MDISELWIGDGIMSTKSGKTGTFEGTTPDGKVRMKSNHKIFLIDGGHIVRHEEKPMLNIVEKSKVKYADNTYYGDTIDLHIELLNPTMANANPIHILEYQIRKTKSFLEYTVAKRKLKVVVIHGKGTGQLKAEILHLLPEFREIVFHREINNGGAVEIELHYY
jgi:hypothetical protein